MLCVWLPLNGDLHNQGCTPFTISSIEATPTFTAGKIGQCYQRTNSNSQLTNGLRIEDNLIDLFGSTASIAVWVKPLNTHTHYNGTILSSGNWNAKKWAFGVSQDNTKVDVLCGNYNTYINCTVAVNEWTHLVSIYDNGTCTLYKNGTYIGQLTGQKAFETDATWTGICRETYAGGYFGFCGCINDLRIYDHALSAAEVKEISQGLVLHYKLDQANTNLIPTNIFDSDAWKSAIAAHEIYEDRLAYKISNSILYSKTGTGQNDIFSGSIVYQTNTQYTLSITWRDDYRTDNKSSSLYLRFIYSDGSTQTQMISPANSIHEWVHQSITSTIGKTISKITTTYGNGGYLYITDLKLEVGTLDTGMLYTDGGIEDSSGYNHNGTINGNIIISSDTNRYNYSTQFDGVDDSITVPYNAICPENIFTFNLWFKKDALGSKSYETLFGGPSGFEMDTRAGSATTLSLYMASTRSTKRNLVTELSLGNWYMITMTRDGTKEKYYVNGIYQSEIDAKAMPTGVYRIGAWASNTGQNYYGLISDFRIYCTALDADAIRQLYELGAKVDNKQNLHAFELVENNSKIQITKQGQVKCNELEEDEQTKFYQIDQIIETNEIIEL